MSQPSTLLSSQQPDLHSSGAGSHPVATPPVKPLQAPPRVEHFVERPAAYRAIKSRLLAHADGLAITVVHGMGGIGKSTLVAAIAHDQEVWQRFPDGVLWVRLGPGPRNRLLTLSNWIRTLGNAQFQPTIIESARSELQTLLLHKRILIIIDDVWHPEDLEPFVVGHEGCHIVITSRQASIAQQRGAACIDLDVMQDDEAMQLVRKRLRRELEPYELPFVQEVLSLVGYLPLALELAAGQAQDNVAWKELCDNLRKTIADLEALDMPNALWAEDENTARERSLRASLMLSLQRIVDIRPFVQLGLLADGVVVTPAFAAFLWRRDKQSADEELRTLYDKGLLYRDILQLDGERRSAYRIHTALHIMARRVLTGRDRLIETIPVPGLGASWEQYQRELLERYYELANNGLWHTIPADGYIHSHLTWHMEQSGQPELIHALLREEALAPAGRNGWFQVCEQHDLLAIFLDDLRRAWEISEGANGNPETQLALGLECRYALIAASINSVAQSISPEVLSSLVQMNRWSPEHALSYARQIPNPKQCAETLMRLARFLPEAQLDEAEHIARGIDDQYDRVWALTGLAVALPEGAAQDRLWTLVFANATQIAEPWDRAQLFAGLSLHLSEPLRRQALDEAARAIDAIEETETYHYFGNNALEGLFLRLTRRVVRRLSGGNHVWASAKLALLLAEAKRWDDALLLLRGIPLLALVATMALGLPKVFRWLLRQPLLWAAARIDRRWVRARRLFYLVRDLARKKLHLHPETGQDHVILVPTGIGVVRSTIYLQVEISKQLEIGPAALIRAATFPHTSYLALDSVADVVRGEWDDSDTTRQHNYAIGNVIFHISSPDGDSFEDVKSVWLAIPYLLRLIELGYKEEMWTAVELLGASTFITLYLTTPSKVRRIYASLNGEPVTTEVAFRRLWQAFVVARRQRKERAAAVARVARSAEAQRDQALHEVLAIARATRVPWVQAELFASIAPYLAPQHMSEVLEAAHAIKVEKNRAAALLALTRSPAATDALRHKILDDILSVVALIKDSGARCEALTSLAPDLPVLLKRRALDVAWKIEGPWWRARALFALDFVHVNAPHQQGSAQEIEVGQIIRDDNERVLALASLAGHLTEAVHNDVLHTVGQLENNERRVEVLEEIAPHLGWEPLEKAREIARTIRPVNLQQRALDALDKRLRTLALALAKTGDFEGALYRIRMIANKDYQAEGLIVLLPLLPPHLTAEGYETAIEAARQIKEKGTRATRYGELLGCALPDEVQDQVSAQLLSAAFEWWDKRAGIDILLNFAPRMPARRKAEALRLILNIARTIEDMTDRSEVLAASAPQLAALGGPEKAIEAIEAIAPGTPFSKESILIRVLAEVKDPKDHRQLVEAFQRIITRKEKRLEAFAKLLANLSEPAKTQTLKLALSQVMSEPVVQLRARGLVILAPFLNEQELEEALIHVLAVDHEDSCVRLLADLLPYLSEAQRDRALDMAYQAARKIPDVENRARDVLLLLKHIPIFQHTPPVVDKLRQLAHEAALAINKPAVQVSFLKILLPHLSSAGNFAHSQDAMRRAVYNIPDPSTRIEALIEIKEFDRAFADAANHAEADKRVEMLQKLLPNLLVDDVLHEKALALLIEALVADHEGDQAEWKPGQIAKQLLEAHDPVASLKVAWLIRDARYQALALREASLQLVDLSVAKRYHLWQETVHALARRSRRELLFGIAAMAPLIASLDQSAFNELKAALSDVGRWWP